MEHSIYYAVLWDMDGVLADTAEFHFVSWEKILTEYGIPFSRQDFQKLFGMNNEQTITALTGATPDPQQVKEISDRKERLFLQLALQDVQMFPGVTQWLEEFRRLGFLQAVASSMGQEFLTPMLERLGIRGYFNAVVSGEDLPSKPAPDVFLEAARALGAAPADCVVIEDSTAGLTAARKAGMKCIAVATTHPAEKLKSADLVVERLTDLTSNALFSLIARN